MGELQGESVRELEAENATSNVPPASSSHSPTLTLSHAPTLPAAVRTTGTAIALTGMLVLLAAVALAWPRSGSVVLVCTLNFAVLTAVAFAWRLPVAHAVALPCLAVGYLTAFHLPRGDVIADLSLWQVLFLPSSGTALVVPVMLLAVVAEWLVRAGQRSHGVFYAVGGGVLALVSLVLVSWAVKWFVLGN